MTDEVIDNGRRRFLTVATAAVGGAGAIAAVTPFIKSWQPSARAKAAGAPTLVDISKIDAGQRVRYPWRSLPVFLVNRTREQLEYLSGEDSRLTDPHSEVQQQPKYAQNAYRSFKNESKKQWLVVIGICTHLGCVPEFVPEVGPEPFDPQWKGGFFCPCHKSRYDMAGRVYKGVPAPTNLVVPPYHFVDDTHILIGVNPKETAS